MQARLKGQAQMARKLKLQKAIIILSRKKHPHHPGAISLMDATWLNNRIISQRFVQLFDRAVVMTALFLG